MVCPCVPEEEAKDEDRSGVEGAPAREVLMVDTLGSLFGEGSGCGAVPESRLSDEGCCQRLMPLAMVDEGVTSLIDYRKWNYAQVVLHRFDIHVHSARYVRANKSPSSTIPALPSTRTMRNIPRTALLPHFILVQPCLCQNLFYLF